MFIRSLILLLSCIPVFAQEDSCGISIKKFGINQDGNEVSAYYMQNKHGMQVGVMEYGATLISIRTADREESYDDVLLGFDDSRGYYRRNYGGITGRFANRIEGARFSIDGVEYNVTKNAGANHIHGGRDNFSTVMWKVGKVDVDNDKGNVSVGFEYFSADGEEGFPGAVTCRVVYTLTDDNSLSLKYYAETDRPTVINLTNHAYFNLAGAGSGNVHNHILQIFASNYTEVDKSLIPTGKILPVKGTALDFTQPNAIGKRIDELTGTRGYDHNYVFDKPEGKMGPAVRAHDPSSGRVMEVLTTEPGMQLYTANHLKDSKGRDGRIYPQHGAFCVETQHYPDSPNKPGFPTTVLRPGKPFTSETVFRFSVEK